MHFKQIELTGFKSFAERTVVDLEHGMTAVVGPNGCGKSNILDAMRWALGEQRPTTLRGAHMQDVIFNGSEERSAMGMAEVTLTFDNADGLLPIDFAEVQVTRRVYRSGDSEYLINRAPCRLRDVHEMFMDTGIGTNAYSMIGQGKIGMVLSSKADDRRYLFEEAAGIIKYKSRKRVAMRKLDQAEQNLLRLGDIIGEVERQTRSLKRQVNAAIRHRELTAQLRELEIRASWLKQQTLVEKIDVLREQFDKAGVQFEEKNTEMNRLEARHEELSLSKLEIDRVLHARRESVHEVDVEMEKIERQVALIRQQITFSIEQKEKAGAERQELLAQADTHREQEEEAELRASGLRSELAEADASLETQQSRLDEAEHDVAEADRRLEEVRARSVESMGVRARTQTAIETVTVNIANLEEQLGVLYARQERDAARTQELSDQIQTRRRTESETGETLTRIEATYTQLSEETERLEEELNATRAEWQDHRENKSATEARLASFRELRDSYEGFAAGVKAIMQAQQEQHPQAGGVIGPVGDLISTQEKFERAVETALGSNMNSIAIETAIQARQAIQYLNDNEAGRVTFLPLDAVRYDGMDMGAEFCGRPGVVGKMIDLIGFDDRYRALMRYLFRDTIVVDRLDTALELLASSDKRMRMVTLRGELIAPSGAITGGRVSGEARGPLGRSAEIEDMEQALVEIEADLMATSTNVDSLRDKLAGTKRRAGETNTQLNDVRAAMAEIGLKLTQMTAELEKLAESAHTLAAERDEISARRETLERERLDSIELATTMESEEKALESELATAQDGAAHARQKQSALSSELADLRVTMARLSKSIEETERDRNRHRQDVEVAKTEAGKRAETIQEFESNRVSLERDIEEHLERSKALAESKEDARQKVVEAENQRQALLDESDAIDKELKTVREAVRETQSLVHRTEIDLRHDEDQLRFFRERIQSEYGVALGSLNDEEVGTDDLDEKTRDDKVAEIRERLDRMGTVNLMAIEEYEALTERHDFLVAQDEDLRTARETLLSVVERIDATIRDMFLDTFNAVAENFREYFRRLFNGGQARIYLVDPDDPLESGIEIEARPPGKKPQLISLLSGGEQAMTAIALLFGIFKAKPSPFCVLDEVDAPLDDANIGRFVSMVDEFSKDTQFVIITHNKQTMARADALYGVTQQERGVSEIVSVRFDAATEAGTAA